MNSSLDEAMAQPIKNFVVDSLRVRVYATQDQLVQDAAREVESYLQQVLMAQGRAAAILVHARAGGGSGSTQSVPLPGG